MLDSRTYFLLRVKLDWFHRFRYSKQNIACGLAVKMAKEHVC